MRDFFEGGYSCLANYCWYEPWYTASILFGLFGILIVLAVLEGLSEESTVFNRKY